MWATASMRRRSVTRRVVLLNGCDMRAIGRNGLQVGPRVSGLLRNGRPILGGQRASCNSRVALGLGAGDSCATMRDSGCKRTTPATCAVCPSSTPSNAHTP